MEYINQVEIEKFQYNLVSLKQRSVRHYSDTHQMGKFSFHRSKDFNIIPTFIDDMEYYFYSLLQFGYIDSDNVSKVVRNFDEISYVEPLTNENERIFGLTTGQVISINPELNHYRSLSKKDFEQLIISHELGHIINRAWKNESFHFAEELYANPRVRSILRNMGLDSYEYLKQGFELLDEVITQEVAEEVTYLKKNQKRPIKEYRNDKAIFEHQSYLTNYNLYGEFQEVAISFAKTLSFLNIRSNNSDEVVLQKLVKVAFHRNFISLLKKEFMNESTRFDFFVMMLSIMGKMKSSTYQLVGLSQQNGEISINSMIDTYYEIGRLNQGVRKPYTYVKR